MNTDHGLIIELDVVLPAEGQKLTVYADFLLKLQARQDFFSRNLGYSSWLQGKILNMARKRCKRGEWGKFLATIEVGPGKTLKPGTARLCRRIADLVVGSQATVTTLISQFTAVSIHTVAMFTVMGIVAIVVFEKIGLTILRRAWFNLDKVWAIVLIVTGAQTLVL